MRIKTKEMTLVALFAALTAVGAQISFPLPFSPVPVTLQVLFVLLAGALLGSRLGALSQGVYVLLGVVGLPVFAQFHGGIGVLAGPTGGYLIGFMLAAYLVGLIIEKLPLPRLFSAVLAMLLGIIIIYALGVFWLAYQTHVSLGKAMVVGVYPFLIGDLLKLLIAVFATVTVRPQLLLLERSRI